MFRSLRKRSAGFTLIEVLVGTTLLALMMSLLMSGLFSIGRGTRMGEARFDELDSQRLVQAFLRQQIAGAVPLTERVDRRERVFFEGHPDRIRFVGRLPAHRGGGGLQYLHLGAEQNRGRNELMLEYRNAWRDLPFTPPDSSEDWESAALVSGVGSVRFRFFGREDEESAPGWTDRWIGRDRLPSLVKLELELPDDTHWPALAIFVSTPTAAGQSRLFREERER